MHKSFLIEALLALWVTHAWAWSPKITPFTSFNGNGATGAPLCIAASAKATGEYAESWCFGTTFAGGQMNNGVVYRVKPDGTRQSVVLSFDVYNGLLPSVGVAIQRQGSNVIIYGTTTQGGSFGSGIAFKLTLPGGSVETIHSFVGPNGTTPQGAAVLIGSKLYSLPSQAGEFGYGAIVSIDVKSAFTLFFIAIHILFDHLCFVPYPGTLHLTRSSPSQATRQCGMIGAPWELVEQ
jgi:uncharacterized repeat protein (TIGR03803 family)